MCLRQSDYQPLALIGGHVELYTLVLSGEILGADTKYPGFMRHIDYSSKNTLLDARWVVVWRIFAIYTYLMEGFICLIHLKP